MNFNNSTSFFEIPVRQHFFRVQLAKAIKGTLRRNGLFLRPPTGLINRFDLAGFPTAYLGDCKATALYESLLRRSTTVCNMNKLRDRCLVTFENRKPLQLADLRPLCEQYPVLISERYRSTQDFAQDCMQKGLDGVAYASAQHPSHTCLALFPKGISKLALVHTENLVLPGSNQLLQVLATALVGSQIPLIDP